MIEKELIGIIKNIQALPSSNFMEIEKLLEKHKENPKVSTIYDNIFDHLPYSLKVLGDNPIKLLYKQTSEGLHSLSEDDCMAKSQLIVDVLKFTIQKLNEKRSELKDLKEKIRSLQ